MASFEIDGIRTSIRESLKTGEESVFQFGPVEAEWAYVRAYLIGEGLWEVFVRIKGQAPKTKRVPAVELEEDVLKILLLICSHGKDLDASHARN